MTHSKKRFKKLSKSSESTKTGKAKNIRKRLYSKENLKIDKIQILLLDHSSYFSDPCDVEKIFLVPDCSNEPAIGDYVLVEFKTFPRKYYVGKITKNKDFEGDYKISYMQKKRNITDFFPEVTDLASVKEKDIRAVLPASKGCGSTSRQRSSLKFDYDFFSSMYINNLSTFSAVHLSCLLFNVCY